MRVVLHNRKVKAWVLARSDVSDGFVPFGGPRLSPLIAVAGAGVDPAVVDLAVWAARRYRGPLRAVLRSASAPRLRDPVGRPRRTVVADPAPADIEVLRVGPKRSALSIVADEARRGPLLVLCPTLRMARSGAAWLRRQGFTVAEHPEQWSAAAGGADVTIGSRSACWAPVPGLSGIVIVDEHDDVYVEERTPRWSAREVAIERARNAGVRCVMTSPVPSLASSARQEPRDPDEGASAGIASWPRIEIVDMTDERQTGKTPGTALSSRLIELCRQEDTTVAVVASDPGEGAVTVCGPCGAAQRCPRCGSYLTMDTGGLGADGGETRLACRRCGTDGPPVCGSCGRPGLRATRPGVAGLLRQLAKATPRPVRAAPSDGASVPDGDAVRVGTMSILGGLVRADAAVFVDVDRILASSMLSAEEILWGRLALAGRVVAPDGTIVLQTRSAGHPLIAALAESESIEGAHRAWLARTLQLRRELVLPPFAHVAVIEADWLCVPETAAEESPEIRACRWSREGDRVTVMSPDLEAVLAACDAFERAQAGAGGRLGRVDVDPAHL